MNKTQYSWFDLERDCNALSLNIALSGWLPDYVAAIARGGCVPAVMISHMLKVPMHALHISLRHSEEPQCESNCWMAEDAYGPGTQDQKNILIVDDINDTGATFQWLQDDWQKSCYPHNSKWTSIWNHNVKFAVLHNNEASQFKTVDFSANQINKAERNHWIVYPWERD